MTKRAVILLGICSFLAVTILTIRYIEGEREEIKARFTNPPEEKKIKIRRRTTSVISLPEEPDASEIIPVKAEEKKISSLEKGKTAQEEEIAPVRGKTEVEKTIPKAIRGVKKKKVPIQLEKEEDIAEEKEVPTEEEKVTPEEDEVPIPPEEEKGIEGEEKSPAIEEDTDVEEEEPDDEGEEEEEVATGEDDRVVLEEESEIADTEDEEEVVSGEEEGKEIAPSEEVMPDHEEEEEEVK